MALDVYKKRINKTDGGSTAPINKPSFQNAFDAYKTQLELSKVNAKNEVAKSTRVAANYLDNYLKQYGLRGSGLGQSAYTNLAAQQATANANIDAEQRSKLNQNILSEGKELLSGYNDAQAQSYLDKLKGSKAVDSTTIDSLSNYRDYYKNMNQGTFEDQRVNSMSSLRDIIESGSLPKDKINTYKEVYNQIYNAKDEPTLKDALSRLESVEYSPYDIESDMIRDSGEGTAQKPYMFENKSIKEVEDFLNNGEITINALRKHIVLYDSNGKKQEYEVGKNRNGYYLKRK